MTKPIPEGWHSVTPRLVVQDPAMLVEFLKQAFGATGDFRTDSPSVIRIGDSLVMVSGVGPRDPMPAFLYFYLDDIDTTYQRALEAGAVSLEEPRDVPYGDPRGMVKDPCGNVWQIATHIEDLGLDTSPSACGQAPLAGSIAPMTVRQTSGWPGGASAFFGCSLESMLLKIAAPGSTLTLGRRARE